MDDLEKKKKEAKKKYNEAYLSKLRNSNEPVKEKVISPDEIKKEYTKDELKKMINDEMLFFLKTQKTQPQATPPATPIILQAPPSNLKNKMLETLMITSLGLIPLIFKAVYQAKFTSTSTDTQPKPSNTQQQLSMDTQLLFS